MTEHEDMPDGTEGSERQRVVGEGDDPQHRVPEGEGTRAGLAEETGGPPQTSIYDGKGNESVVVLADDEEGKPREGTGPDLESALAEAKNPKKVIGDAFNPSE